MARVNSNVARIGRLLYYASLVCAAAYLARSGFFDVSLDRLDFRYALPALALVCAGFFVNAAAWRAALSLFAKDVTFKTALFSSGRAVFSKYIPGKIWIIVSRALMASRCGVSETAAGFASILAQAAAVCTGLLSGMVLFLAGDFSPEVKTAGAAAALLLLVLLLSRPLQVKGFSAVARLMKRNIDVFDYSTRDLAVVVLLFFAEWVTWGAGFMFLVRMFPGSPEWVPALCAVFPLSVTLGIIAVFAPGGLGVREGVMGALLVVLGVKPETAAAVAIVARAWFLAGELFVFGLSFAVRPKADDR